MSRLVGSVDFSAPAGEPRLWAVARLDNRSELAPLDPLAATDAELILAAYRRWGTACPEYLLGDFAFALWDPGKGRLLCARDPLGIKTFHYARVGPRLVFASEARQLLALPEIAGDLDSVAAGQYLCGMPVDPGRSFFRDVRRLPPAHRLTATAGRLDLERYWDVDPERRTLYRRPDDYAEHCRELLERAVADRLPRDGAAVGVLMSGGLDSCSVAALAHQRLQSAAGPSLVACSMVFETLRECDERPWIDAMRRELGIEVLTVDAERFPILGDAADREAVRPSLESPFLGWETSFRKMTSRLRQQGARVVLTGQGGDEVLGGSSLVYADRLRRGDLRAVGDLVRYARSSGRRLAPMLYRSFATPLLPASADRTLRRLLGRRVPGPRVPGWLEPGFVRAHDLRAWLRAEPERQRFADAARQQIYDVAVGWTTYGRPVAWYDRAASALGVEIRHPFLDRRLVEFATSIPPRLLRRADRYKPLLRQATRGLLPEPVRQRLDKTRLGAFVDRSLRQTAAKRLDQLLETPLSSEFGIINAKKLRAVARDYHAGRTDLWTHNLWYAITFELWLETYRDSIATPQPTRRVAA